MSEEIRLRETSGGAESLAMALVSSSAKRYLMWAAHRVSTSENVGMCTSGRVRISGHKANKKSVVRTTKTRKDNKTKKKTG